MPLLIVGKNDRNKIFVGKMCAINFELFQIYASLVAFFLPLVIMFIMYTLTIRTLRRQARLVSTLLVHNGKNSPPNSGRNLSFRRKNSAQFHTKVLHKNQRLGRPLKRRESAMSTSETDSESNRFKSSFGRHPKCCKYAKQNSCNTVGRDKSKFSCKFLHYNPLLKRLKLFLCIESLKKENHNELFVSETGMSRRYVIYSLKIKYWEDFSNAYFT